MIINPQYQQNEQLHWTPWTQKKTLYMTLKSQVLALDRHENVAGLNWLMEAFLDINFSIILTYITFIRIMVFLYFFKKSSYKFFLQHVNSLIFSLHQKKNQFFKFPSMKTINKSLDTYYH